MASCRAFLRFTVPEVSRESLARRLIGLGRGQASSDCIRAFTRGHKFQLTGQRCPVLHDTNFMFSHHAPITTEMNRGMFFTNHLGVLTLVARDPDIRLREIASGVGITERAAHRIISELIDEGYLARDRAGTRNQYTVLRFPLVDPDAAELLRQAIGEEASPAPVLAADGDGLDAV